MQLLKARLNGVGYLARSDWFELSLGLNLVHIPDARLRQAFLRQLATINPVSPFSCSEVFSNTPAALSERGYARRINPSKRTAALAVFAAAPSLIVELGKIESILDNVDRIEVGRRLDGSRWFNFVEIASACRWWEIEADVVRLLDTLDQHYPNLGQVGTGLTADLEPSRRIKDDLEKALTGWLARVLAENLPVELKALANQVFHDVTRPSRVALGKILVEERLPRFIDLAALPSLTEASGSNSHASQVYLGERVVLIDGEQVGLAVKSAKNLEKLLGKPVDECQVIYAFGDFDRLPASYSTLARRTVPGLRLESA